MHHLTISTSLFTLALGGLAVAADGGPLDATWAAHGGLDAWRVHGQMRYRLEGFPLSPAVAKTSRSIVDLVDRRNRIEGPDYTVGFDGERAWVEPHADAVGLRPRFYTLGSFYFIGMPFVFADPGVLLTERAAQTFRGKTYRVVNVGYRRGTGYTSKDDYVLFIDPDTDRLALIHHSVTENDGVDRVTWVFDAWQTVGGVLVPARMTFFVGFDPEPDGEGASFTIEDVVLERDRPDAALYRKPATAEYDPSPLLH